MCKEHDDAPAKLCIILMREPAQQIVGNRKSASLLRVFLRPSVGANLLSATISVVPSMSISPCTHALCASRITSSMTNGVVAAQTSSVAASRARSRTFAMAVDESDSGDDGEEAGG